MAGTPRTPKTLIQGRERLLPTTDYVVGAGPVYVKTGSGSVVKYEKGATGKISFKGVVTDSNGSIIVYPTTTGAASGTALFSEITDVNVQLRGSQQTIGTNRVESISADNKTIVVRLREIGISILGVVNVNLASPGVECIISVEGVLA